MSSRAATGRSRLAIVTSDPGYPDPEATATAGLIRDLLAQARHTDVSIVLTERPRRSGLVGEWRRAGARVQVGPPDPNSLGEEWGFFSHVLMTSGGARSRAVEWVDKTQPQAARIVFLAELPWRRAQRAWRLTVASDRPGLDHETAVRRDGAMGLLEWADAIWCGSDAEAELAGDLVPGRTISVLPRAVEIRARPAGWAERAGVVVTALDGYDAQRGADEDALDVINDVIPRLRRTLPSLPATLVADGANAGLRAAAAGAGVALAGRDRLDQVIGISRVLVGTATAAVDQPAAFEAALRAGTPLAVGAAAARRLLSSRRVWAEAVASADRLATERWSPDRRAERIGRALASVGLTPGRPVHRPVPRVTAPRARWDPRPKNDDGLRPRAADAGSGGRGDQAPSGPAGAPPMTADEKYRVWSERHRPTPAVARQLRADVDRYATAPFFSVIMPVYNTPAALLDEAVDSVRAQIYERWELCIGNDGSDRAETRSVLDRLRGDPRIKVVDRPDQGGISAATNSALAVAAGDFVAFLDHDDVLKPHALVQMARWLAADPSLDLVYSDEDILGADGQLKDVHLKPDWSPDQLLAQNYICHLTVARRSLVQEVGGLRSDLDGSQDYDLVLRLTERTDRIGHVPEPLYSWRAAPGSFAADLGSKPYAVSAGQRALEAAVARRGLDATVATVADSGRYRVRYSLPGQPHVSVIIPTRDRVDLLRRCIGSLTERTSYPNYEIVIVDNQSTDAETLGYLASGPWQVIRYPHPFNYARMTNLAAGAVRTDALLFLNNDTEVIDPEWMEALLEQAMRPEVGAVGGRLFFGDDRPQHEGIMIGNWGDWANNVDHRGYFHRGEMVRNTSAVTGACCMIRPSVYERVGGADPRLRVAYNDVDLCLRIRRAGYEIVYTPWARLYHHEGSSRGDYQHGEDAPVFRDRWDPRNVLDPYYSPVFSDAVPFEVAV